jgi:AcrR family transcriptional regulator
LLRAAEHCFAAAGYEGASLRAITRRAGVNLAAVNYHFSSKQELWMEMMQRRLRPLNAERLRLLAAARAATPPGQTLSVAQVCAAMLRPIVKIYEHGRPNPAHVRLVGRVFTEPPALRKLLDRGGLDEISRVFRAALREALPHCSPREIDWKYYCLACAMLGALARQGRQPGIQGPMDTGDIAELVRHLTAFVTGGVQAAPPGAQGQAAP